MAPPSARIETCFSMWQKLATNLTDYAYHGFQERHHSESKREQDVNAPIVSRAFFRGSYVEIG